MAAGMVCGYGRRMERGRPSLARLGARVVSAGDVLLPTVLAGLAIYEIWVGTLADPGFAGPRLLQTLGALLMIVPLGWRRRYPVAVLMCVLVGAAVEWPWLRSSGQLSFEAFVAVLVAWYSVGAHAHAQPRRGLRALGLVLVVLVAADIADTVAGYHEPFDNAALYPLLFVAWALGNAFRKHGTRERELEARAAALEREREEKVRVAAAQERVRIARELHDVVAHSVSVMVVQVGGARGILDAEPDTARETLQSAEQTGRQALAEMRRMLGILRGPDDARGLAPQPSLDDVDTLIAQAREAGLSVEIHTEGRPHTLSPGIDLAAYRIVQEALTNTVKHAGPAHAQVVLRYAPDQLEIEVCDDGHGPPSSPADRADPGHGLVGMRERVAIYGGALSAGRRNGGGFAIHARLPLEPHGR
jgi:signal transduction histidine kinase